MGGKDWKMNVFDSENEAREYVENTYGFIADNLRRLTEFSYIQVELPITPFMVKRCGRVGYSMCISISIRVLVKGNYTEVRLGFEE